MALPEVSASDVLAVLDVVEDGLIAFDNDGNHKHTNAAARRMIESVPGLEQTTVDTTIENWIRNRRPITFGMHLKSNSAEHQMQINVSIEALAGTPWFVLRLKPVVAQVNPSEVWQSLMAFREFWLPFAASLHERVTPRFYEQLLEVAARLIAPMQAGSILVRQDNGRYTYRAAIGYDLGILRKVTFNLDEIYFATLAPQQAESFVVRDLDQQNAAYLDSNRMALLRAAGPTERIRDTLAVPVTVGADVVAFLMLDNLTEERAFKHEHQVVAEILAAQISVIIKLLRDQEASDRARSFFERLYLNSPAATVVVEADTLIVRDANQNFFALTERTREQVLGLPVTKLALFSTAEYLPAMRKLRQGGRVEPWESEVLTGSGAFIWCRIAAEGGYVGDELLILFTVLDIDKQKRLDERLREAVRGAVLETKKHHDKMLGLLEQEGRVGLETSYALQLTERERNILLGLSTGTPIPEIATSLSMSPDSLKNSMSRLYRKVGVKSRSEVLAWFHRQQKL